MKNLFRIALPCLIEGLIGGLIGAGTAFSANASRLPVDFYKTPPKLILVISVDQLRSDYLTRFESRLLPALLKSGKVGGIKFLMKKGSYYPFGQQTTLQNMTGPGHAAIMTGSHPRSSKIPLNNWWLADKKEFHYCIADPKYPVILQSGKIDPLKGRSPRGLKVSTVSDEYKNAGYAGKVVSIAIKDRAAVLMGGHRADQVYWFDFSNMRWISSQFYFPDKKLPLWLESYNDQLSRRKGQTYTWSLTRGKKSGLSRKDGFLKDWPQSKKFGIGFPKKVTLGDFYTVALPFGNKSTLEVAKKAMINLKLGRGKHTDFLIVGYSSFDYTGHSFGPSSLEMEEAFINVDRSISELLNFVKSKVPGGLKNVTVVLTGDHGIASSPEWLSENKMPASRIDDLSIQRGLEKEIRKKLGKPKDDLWVAKTYSLNFWFSHTALKSLSQKKKSKLYRIAKNYLQQTGHFTVVFTRDDFEKGIFPQGFLGTKTKNTYIPGMSGDLIGIPYTNGIAHPYDAAKHMTAYRYDSSVPIILYGRHFKAGIYAEYAEVIDIAPTLSFLLGTLPPSASEGKILSGALQ